MATTKTVTFRDGTVTPLYVLQCLWDIEARGGTFVLHDDGSFKVVPPIRVIVVANTF
jgi:hypothetical protein